MRLRTLEGDVLRGGLSVHREQGCAFAGATSASRDASSVVRGGRGWQTSQTPLSEKEDVLDGRETSARVINTLAQYPGVNIVRSTTRESHVK